MPAHLVGTYIAAGRLKQLEIDEHRGREFSFPLHVMHERSRRPAAPDAGSSANSIGGCRSLARN
jgi:hypothetical protein